MAKINVTMKDDDSLYKDIISNYGSGFQYIEFEVGLFEDENPQETKKGIWNEFGTSTIPSRPFMTPTLEDNMGYIEKKLVKGARNLRDMVDVTEEVAEDMVEKVQTRIINQTKIRPQLSETTIRLKGNNLKLIETDAMFDAIKYRKLIGR